MTTKTFWEWVGYILFIVIWLTVLWCCNLVTPANGKVFIDLNPQGKNYGVVLKDVSLYRYERRVMGGDKSWEGYGLDLKVVPRVRIFYQVGECRKNLPLVNQCSYWVSKRYERGIIWDVVKTPHTTWYLTLYNYDIDFWGYYREGGNLFADENHYVITGGLRIKI